MISTTTGNPTVCVMLEAGGLEAVLSLVVETVVFAFGRLARLFHVAMYPTDHPSQ